MLKYNDIKEVDDSLKNDILKYIKKNPSLSKSELQKLVYNQNSDVFNSGSKFRVVISDTIEDMIKNGQLNFKAKKTRAVKSEELDFDVPILVGSEKQVEWANKIRNNFIKSFKNSKTQDKKDVLKRILMNISSAKEYIEMRNMI